MSSVKLRHGTGHCVIHVVESCDARADAPAVLAHRGDNQGAQAGDFYTLCEDAGNIHLVQKYMLEVYRQVGSTGFDLFLRRFSLAIHRAVRAKGGDFERRKLIHTLLSAGFSALNTTDKDNRSALCIAAGHNVESVRAILTHESYDASALKGIDPLFMASSMNKLVICQELIRGKHACVWGGVCRLREDQCVHLEDLDFTAHTEPLGIARLWGHDSVYRLLRNPAVFFRHSLVQIRLLRSSRRALLPTTQHTEERTHKLMVLVDRICAMNDDTFFELILFI